MDSSFEKSVITQIKDAKIELSKTALHERKLRVMKEGISPSKIAEEVLENYEKEQKNLQVKEKAEADKKAKQTLDVSDKVQEDTSQK